MSRAFDRNGQGALVAGAGTGHAAGKNLCAFRDKPAKPGYIFIIDIAHPVHTKAAHLFAAIPSAPLRPLASFVSFHNLRILLFNL